MSKLGLKGFKNFSFFPIVEDSSEKYEVASQIKLPNVISMTRDIDNDEQKIYADDNLYMNIKSFNGISATITVAELCPKLRATLGDGDYDDDTCIFTYKPDKGKPSFAASYQVGTTGGGARLYQLFKFNIEEIRDGEHRTTGDGTPLQTHDIIGTFTKRRLDDSVGASKDVENLSDLSFLEVLNVY